MTVDDFKAKQAYLGLTNVALAHQLGVAPNTVTRWRMGRHPIPLTAQFLLLRLDARPPS